MAPPRFRPTPEQQVLLGQLEAAAAKVDELEKAKAEAEARRNELLLAAVQAGIKVNAAAAAGGLGRPKAYPILRSLGYDPNTPDLNG